MKYEPGELKVVAYKDGKEWATDTVKTTGAAGKLSLKPDRDDDHRRRPRSLLHHAHRRRQRRPDGPALHEPLNFEISGPGEIVATDNGDPTSLESFQPNR